MDSMKKYKVRKIKVEINLENPTDYAINPSPTDVVFTEPYEGANDQLVIPIDFSDGEQVPKETTHPHRRFVGRKVRKIFPTPTGGASRMKAEVVEGTVKSYQEQRQLFKISYDDGDREEVDFTELMETRCIYIVKKECLNYQKCIMTY